MSNLYHGTTEDRIDGILANGLEPDSWLTDSFNMAGFYARQRYECRGSSPVVMVFLHRHTRHIVDIDDPDGFRYQIHKNTKPVKPIKILRNIKKRKLNA